MDFDNNEPTMESSESSTFLRSEKDLFQLANSQCSLIESPSFFEASQVDIPITALQRYVSYPNKSQFTPEEITSKVYTPKELHKGKDDKENIKELFQCQLKDISEKISALPNISTLLNDLKELNSDTQEKVAPARSIFNSKFDEIIEKIKAGIGLTNELNNVALMISESAVSAYEDWKKQEEGFDRSLYEDNKKLDEKLTNVNSYIKKTSEDLTYCFSERFNDCLVNINDTLDKKLKHIEDNFKEKIECLSLEITQTGKNLGLDLNNLKDTISESIKTYDDTLKAEVSQKQMLTGSLNEQFKNYGEHFTKQNAMIEKIPSFLNNLNKVCEKLPAVEHSLSALEKKYEELKDNYCVNESNLKHILKTLNELIEKSKKNSDENLKNSQVIDFATCLEVFKNQFNEFEKNIVNKFEEKLKHRNLCQDSFLNDSKICPVLKIEEEDICEDDIITETAKNSDHDMNNANHVKNLKELDSEKIQTKDSDDFEKAQKINISNVSKKARKHFALQKIVKTTPNATKDISMSHSCDVNAMNKHTKRYSSKLVSVDATPAACANFKPAIGRSVDTVSKRSSVTSTSSVPRTTLVRCSTSTYGIEVPKMPTELKGANRFQHVNIDSAKEAVIKRKINSQDCLKMAGSDTIKKQKRLQSVPLISNLDTPKRENHFETNKTQRSIKKDAQNEKLIDCYSFVESSSSISSSDSVDHNSHLVIQGQKLSSSTLKPKRARCKANSTSKSYDEMVDTLLDYKTPPAKQLKLLSPLYCSFSESKKIIPTITLD